MKGSVDDVERLLPGCRAVQKAEKWQEKLLSASREGFHYSERKVGSPQGVVGAEALFGRREIFPDLRAFIIW